MQSQAKGDKMDLLHRIHSENTPSSLEANLSAYVTEIKSFIQEGGGYHVGQKVRLSKKVTRNGVTTQPGVYSVEEYKASNNTVRINTQFVSTGNMQHVTSLFGENYYVNHIGRELNTQIIRFGLEKYFENQGGHSGIKLDNPDGGGYRPVSFNFILAS